MSTQPTETSLTITISLAELETLLRRIVREEVTHLLQQQAPQSLTPDDTEQEEPDDPQGDAMLLQEAIEVLETTPPDAWLDWEEVKRELDRAEAAGELPD